MKKPAPFLLTAALLNACAGGTPSAPTPTSAVEAAVAGAPVVTPSQEPVKSDPVPAGPYLFYEDFEHGQDRWTMPAAGSAAGWRVLHAHTCDGDYTMLYGQDAQAPFSGPAAESVLALNAPLDLTGAKKPVLKYDVKGEAVPDSAGSITAELKAPGGDWQAVGRISHANHAYAASVVSDLTPWVGQQVQLRFRADLAASSQTTGLYLDDIAVIEPQ